MKKTYRVKNYKGNLVESLKKFSDFHRGMKIVEATEDGDDLKIKTKRVNEVQAKFLFKTDYFKVYSSEDEFEQIYGEYIGYKKFAKTINTVKVPLVFRLVIKTLNPKRLPTLEIKIQDSSCDEIEIYGMDNFFSYIDILQDAKNAIKKVKDMGLIQEV